QAVRMSYKAITLASELSHPTTLAHARLYSAMFGQLRKEAPETQKHAEALERLTAVHGLPSYSAAATVLLRCALAESGQGEDGAAQIREGIAALRATNTAYLYIYFLALLAEAYREGGKAPEGLAVLAEALRTVEGTGMRLYEPEMHRLRGELLL